MSELLSLLRDLLPLWALALVLGFAYLLALLKRASDSFLEIAKGQATYMQDRVDVVDKSTGIFTRTIDQQEKEIKRLQDQLQRLGADIQSTRETDARLSIQELTMLSREIERLSAEHSHIFEFISRTDPTLAYLPIATPQLTAVREDIGRAIRARDLSIYPVLVLAGPGADRVVSRLRQAGYAASIYESEAHIDDPGDRQEGIWLGAMIPPGNAIEIIQTAHKEWPHLRYVHLSTDSAGPEDTHYTIFLGGSSFAAAGHLRCAPWAESDFEGLSAAMSFDELHAYVRERYRDGTPTV